MRKLLKKTIQLIVGNEPTQTKRLRKMSKRDLIRMESKLGAEIFGPVSAGHRREFFCLDAHTWIWYEQWLDENNKPKEMTTRYEIHKHGVIKVQDGHPYTMIEGDELKNLMHAVKMYRDRVAKEIYQRDPETGLRLLEQPSRLI